MRANESETQLQCTCGWLERAAAEPSKPIEHDVRTNEYRLVTQHPAGRGYSILHFCPWCGCRCPESRNHSLFAKPTDTELRRLVDLTGGLRTVAHVIQVLGEPDRDSPNGYVETRPGSATTPRHTTVHRTLVYDGLSETAQVTFTDLHDGTVSVSFRGKYLGLGEAGGGGE